MSKDKVTNIGGYEFHIVKHGLDAAEVMDFAEKCAGNEGGVSAQRQLLSSAQDFAKRMEDLAAHAEQVAEQLKQEAQWKTNKLLSDAQQVAEQTKQEAQAERTRLLTDAQQQARELIAEAETVAATMRKEAAEVQHKARELVAETERAEAAMRSQAQELIQAAQSRAERVIVMTRDLALHGIPGAAGRVCQELVSMLDGLEAELKASPGSQGQTAGLLRRFPKCLLVAKPVTAEGEAEAQPEAEEPEEAAAA